MAVELASAYITISARTDRIPRDVARALGQAQAGARRQGEQTGRQFSGGLADAMRRVGPAAGVAGVVTGLGAALKGSLAIGMDFTSSLNTMRAVSQATAAQMDQVSARARELGNDISLPGTSANDAAAAMTELAKGGFSVQQSMDAAKGSLQLAAAAGIDASSAATIQAQTLQTFGLGADQAGRAADVLANSANASTAEIGDVAQALQAGGTVAKQFGLSMEDTAAAISTFANNGITGSDAGTLLKSTLVAVTDTGKPAVAAMKELGLQAYDAQGRFVGMSSLMRQLGDASGRMTQQQYQAATAVLFGTDAIRLSGLAGEAGARQFDAMREAMARQGSAAEVAAAKTAGLPGAWERVKNAAESAGLSLYDVIQGPLTSAANSTTTAIGGIERLAGGIGSALFDAYQGFAASGQLDEWSRRVVDVFNGIVTTAKELGPAFATLGTIAAQAAGAVGYVSWEVLLTTMEAINGVLQVAAPLLSSMTGFLEDNKTAVVGLTAAYIAFRLGSSALTNLRAGFNSVAAGTTTATRSTTGMTGSIQRLGMTAGTAQARLLGLSAAARGVASANGAVVTTANHGAVTMGRFGSAIERVGRSSPALAGMQSSFVNAAAGAQRFGRTAGTAAAAGSGLRAAGAGLAGVFGGPVGLALTGAAVAGTAWMSSVSQQKALTEGYRSALADLNEQQKTTRTLLQASGGQVTGDVLSSFTSQIDAYRTATDKAAQNDGRWTDVVKDITVDMFSFGTAVGDTSKAKDTAAAKSQAAQAAFAKLGLTSAEAAKQVTGTTGEWTSLSRRLSLLGTGGQETARDLGRLRAEILLQQEAARRVTPGVSEFADAVTLMGDRSVSAADKTNALKAALDALNPARTKQESMSQYNQMVRDAADSTQQAIDKTKGFGRALFEADGTISTVTQNGSELSKSVLDVVDKTNAAVQNGGKWTEINARNQALFGAMAQRTGVDLETIRVAADKLGYRDVAVSVSLQGKTEAVRGLGEVATGFRHLPKGKTLEIDASKIEPARDLLTKLNFALLDIDKGGVKTVQVIPRTDEAKKELDTILATVQSLPPNKAIDVTAPGGQGVFDLLGKLGAQVTRDNNKNIVVESPLAPDVLNVLNQLGVAVRTDNGKTILVTDNGTAEQVKARIFQIPQNRKVSVEVSAWMSAESQNNLLRAQGIQGPSLLSPPRARGGPISGYATGGGIAANGAISGPGTGTSDSISTMAPIGGHVFTAAETRAAGGSRALSDMLGGHRRTAGPPARPVKLSNGEHYAFPDQVRAAGGHGAIEGLRRRLLSPLSRAVGGSVKTEDFDTLAKGGLGASRALEGALYGWGGVNWGDCSGTQSAFARLAAGLATFGGRFSTATMGSALQAMGALLGHGGPGDMRFGWHNGGPGGGHTSGTLPSNINVEMGGARGDGQYGGGAAGSEDPAHTDHAYFPKSMFAQAQTIPPATNPETALSDARDGTTSASAASAETKPTLATTISGRFGDAASAAVSGQISDALKMFGVSDQLAYLDAANQFTSATDQYRKDRMQSTGLTGSKAQNLETKLGRDRVEFEKKKEYEHKLADLRTAYERNRTAPGAKETYDRKRMELKDAYDRAKFERSQQNQRSKISDPGTQKPRAGHDMGLAQVALQDRGGVVLPGLNLIANKLGKTETTLPFSPSELVASMSAGGDAQEVHNHYDTHINNPTFSDRDGLMRAQERYVNRQKMRFGG